jgi:cold shock protein
LLVDEPCVPGEHEALSGVEVFEMSVGSVKWYDPGKGFGFIMPEGGGPDVFVHHSVLPENLELLVEGQQVEYEAESTPRGLKVVGLKRLEA